MYSSAMEGLAGTSGIIALFSLLALLTLAPFGVRKPYTAAALSSLIAASIVHGLSAITLVGLAGFALVVAVGALSCIIAVALIAAISRMHAVPLQLLYSASLLIPVHIFTVGAHFKSLDNPVAIAAAAWFACAAVLHARVLAPFLAAYVPSRLAAAAAWTASLSALAVALT